MSRKAVERIEQTVTPLLVADGYELVFAEFIEPSRILRLYIDQPDGISLEDCTRVSRLVGDVLDAEGAADGLAGRYTLEVSSPGMDRPLVRPEHFQRFVGSRIKLTTKQPQSGRHRFNGDIVAAGADSIEMKVDGESWTIPYAVIDKARLVPEF